MIHCVTILRRIIGPVGGAWIPYTAAEVARRRAAQMVAVVVCTTVSPREANVPAPAPCCAPPPVGPWTSLTPLPGGLVPLSVAPYPEVVATPEPSSLAVVAVALVALWLARRLTHSHRFAGGSPAGAMSVASGADAAEAAACKAPPGGPLVLSPTLPADFPLTKRGRA